MSEILLLSILAGLATLFGGIIVIALGKPTKKTLAIFLGLAVGIMVAVVVIDLLPSAFKYSNLFTTLGGFFLGIVLLSFIDFCLNFFRKIQGGEKNKNYLLNMGYLIAIGIALHDLPEGIAIAAGYEAEQKLGWLIALSIGLHNIPEGMAAATPLRMAGMSTIGILLINGIVSIFTPLGAIIGYLLTQISSELIAVLLAIAGGAMIYIVRFELIPEAKKFYPKHALLGAIVGFMIIILLLILHH